MIENYVITEIKHGFFVLRTKLERKFNNILFENCHFYIVNGINNEDCFTSTCKFSNCCVFEVVDSSFKLSDGEEYKDKLQSLEKYKENVRCAFDEYESYEVFDNDRKSNAYQNLEKAIMGDEVDA